VISANGSFMALLSNVSASLAAYQSSLDKLNGTVAQSQSQVTALAIAVAGMSMALCLTEVNSGPIRKLLKQGFELAGLDSVAAKITVPGENDPDPTEEAMLKALDSMHKELSSLRVAAEEGKFDSDSEQETPDPGKIEA
jgi:hypothetical protein